MATGTESRPSQPAARRGVPLWRRPSFWLQVALLPALILCVLLAFRTIGRSSSSLEYPFQLDREEAFLLDQALHLSRGETIYPSLDDYPYTVGNYPPVYPMIYGAAIRWLPALQPSLPAGRLLVLVAGLIAISVIVNAILRDARSIAPALLAGALVFMTWDAWNWIAFARVDWPALALGLLGLAVSTSQRRRPAAIFGSLLFALAFFTKQTQILAPMAVFGAYLWRREFRVAAEFAFLMTVWVGGGLAFLTILTGGQFFRHTVLYNVNAFDPGQIVFYLKHLWLFERWRLVATLLAFLFVPLAVWLWPERGGASEETPEDSARKSPEPTVLFPAAGIYLVLAVASIASTGKAGAAVNYLLEFHAAAALFLGLWLARWTREADAADPAVRASRLTMVGLLILFLSAHAVWHGYGRVRQAFQAGDLDALMLVYDGVLRRVVMTDGPVLSEEPIFVLLAEKDVLFQPFIMSRLAAEGAWDQAPFLEDLESAKFGLIVTTQDLRVEDQFFQGFTPEMRQAIVDAYEFDRQIGSYYLYVPKTLEDTPDGLPRDRFIVGWGPVPPGRGLPAA